MMLGVLGGVLFLVALHAISVRVYGDSGKSNGDNTKDMAMKDRMRGSMALYGNNVNVNGV